MQVQQEIQPTSRDLYAAWKSRIDDLAIMLKFSVAGAETFSILRSLGDEARMYNASECVQVVDSLVSRLEEDIKTGTAYLLKQGIKQLHESLEVSNPLAETNNTPASLGEDAELVSDFLVEAREHLSQIEGQMLILERDPSAMTVIHAVFRAFHTIKGLAGFLDFSTVQALAHEVETLLDMARNEKLVINSSIVDVVLESGDSLQVELNSIEHALNQGGAIRSADHNALVRKIQALALPQISNDEMPKAFCKSSATSFEEEMLDYESTPASLIDRPLLSTSDKSAKSVTKSSTARTGRVKKTDVSKSKLTVPEINTKTVMPNKAGFFDSEQVLDLPILKSPKTEAIGKSFEASDGGGFVKLYSAQDRAVLLAAQTSSTSESMHTSPRLTTPQREEKNAVAVSVLTTTPPAMDAARSASIPNAPAKEVTKSADASSVRVETAKLDHLMDMVGEIVIAQSLIGHNQAFASATDSRLMADLAQLARVTDELQRATMSMRMVPMGQLFQRVERVIRDLSRKAGKQVVLETSGQETEIDKTVAEELSDPLMHMVRNSVDHGIETAAERVANGKTAVAHIKLSARHQGGQVVIEISDDGRGLNAEKIRRKAEEKHLISASAVLTETETFQLIFEPGFSTAEKITDVSGRGVGMDVVRKNVEKLRGNIETRSTLGQGTNFALKLPLTLAIIDGLVVEVGTDRYIIPLSGVREIFRPQPDQLFTIEGRDEMLLVRGQLMPVIKLHQRLGIQGRATVPSEGLIVVVESQNKCFCLLIDDLLGKQEVVIKSLGETFKDVSGLSGCAVLGDGRVGLILDMNGIYRGGR